MQSFKQYLIESRYAGDHPLVTQIKQSMEKGDGDSIPVGKYNMEDIKQALTAGFGKPDNMRDPSSGQLGELFWDIDGYDVYFLYPDLHDEDPRDPADFCNVFVDPPERTRRNNPRIVRHQE